MMMLPPAIVDIKRIKNNARELRLFLPLFLLWPMALAVALAMFPFLLILSILYPFALPVRKFFGAVRSAMISCCALRGLEFETESAGKKVKIKVL
jgi:hypothetical protein